MSTRYYYDGPAPLQVGEPAALGSDESRHLLKVMRAKPGQSVIVFGHGGEFQARLTDAGTGSSAVVMPEEKLVGNPPPALAVTMLIPWIKGGKTELVVQKLTELGAHAIIVFQSMREVAKGDADKQHRLQKVAIEACKQSERSAVPLITLADSLSSAVSQCDHIPAEARFILHERIVGKRLSEAVSPLITTQPAMMIASGPEGGWDPRETAAMGAGATLVWLGPRIVRAETAPIAAMAALLALSGDI